MTRSLAVPASYWFEMETDSFQFHQTRASRCGARDGGSSELRRTTDRLASSVLLRSFKLPCGEAPNVDMELVEPRIVAVTSELNLEFQLVVFDRKATDATGCADTRPAPRAVRTSGRELP